MADKIIKEGCVVTILGDEHEVAYRVEHIRQPDDKSRVICELRMCHPNRDVKQTLNIKALIYKGENFIDFTKNYLTSKH